jgi:nitrite reductase/ring-hydroxylating ferredoxin subunit
MPEFVKIGYVSEMGSAGQFSRWVDKHDVLVFNWQGTIRAFSNVCPHFGGPVGFHKMADGKFTCLWHNLQYSVETGQCLSVPRLRLREYKVKVEDNVIYAQLVEDQSE